MKISQTLRKPENWQDFESLCLLLWREEWNSEDLKKNGRNGQSQNGVDICGHKNAEDEYSGIQCKCKPGNKPLSKEEIEVEINNAHTFKPALRRLIIVTTADKDAALEEYVRLMDVANRKKGLFSIDIKSWQDIIDLLERNRSVLNTYLDVVAEDYNIAVSFNNDKEQVTIHPQYYRVHYIKSYSDLKSEGIDVHSDGIHLSLGGLSDHIQKVSEITDVYKTSLNASFRIVRSSIETNHAYCPLKFKVTNQGKTPIDDYKITFYFDNPNVMFIKNNVKKKTMMPELSYIKGLSNIVMENGQCVKLFGDSIIPGDSSFSDDFFIHIPDNVNEIAISWKLLSRHFSTDGELKIIVENEYFDDYKECDEKAGETVIFDYVEKVDIID